MKLVRTTNQFLHCILLEKHGLSFIETSAKDSTNVETAFQSFLTGKNRLYT